MSLKDHPLISNWLRIANGKLEARTGKVDIGQRISSALAQVVHEELTLPYDVIDVAMVTTADSPDEGMTSGSNSIEQSAKAQRQACATLHALALQWAAETHGGAPADWRLENGLLTGPASNEPLPLLDLLEGRDLALPVDLHATPAGPSGQPAPMRGIGDLVTGTYRYVHDIDLPGMLHARLVRPPHAQATLTAVNADLLEKLQCEGLQVHRDGSFLAVLGPREWPVVRGAERLARGCTWQGEGLAEGDIQDQLTRDRAIRMPVEGGVPQNVPVPEMPGGMTHHARYERPFTMHGALAPSAACALWDGETLHVTCHSQGIFFLRDAIAESLELPKDKVVLTYMPGSGCYGHNGADDAALDAGLLALANPGKPLLLKWTREQEHAWEPYGPAQAVELSARVEDGYVAAYTAESIGGTFRGRPRSGAGGAGPARLLSNRFRDPPRAPLDVTPNLNREGGLHRNLTPIYDFGETQLVKNLVPGMPLRTSALRCLGAACNVFALECFVDELAHETGEDPLTFRRRHLSDPRALAVLDRMDAILATAPITGQGRGIAYAQYKNAMARVGAAVDLNVSDSGSVHLEHIILVADAGGIVDRDGLLAQLEGGALQAASWALFEEVSWDRDGVTTRDWDSYPVLRFGAVPRIDIELLSPDRARPLGAGEASPGPVLAAIANAIYDATGLRMRRLPFTPERLTQTALNL